jgi:hypothetical protein
MLNAPTTQETGCEARLQTGSQHAVEIWNPDGSIGSRFMIAMPRNIARDLCAGAECPEQLPALDAATAATFGSAAYDYGWWGAVDRVLGNKRRRNTDARTLADRYWTWSPVAIDCAVTRILDGLDVNQSVGHCRGHYCLLADRGILADRRTATPWRMIALGAAGVAAVAVGIHLAR